MLLALALGLSFVAFVLAFGLLLNLVIPAALEEPEPDNWMDELQQIDRRYDEAWPR